MEPGHHGMEHQKDGGIGGISDQGGLRWHQSARPDHSIPQILCPIRFPWSPCLFKSTQVRQAASPAIQQLGQPGSSLGLVKKDDATIEIYVTRKALDGLYLMIAEQEKAFRQNPVGATSDIVKKVFGAIR